MRISLEEYVCLKNENILTETILYVILFDVGGEALSPFCQILKKPWNLDILMRICLWIHLLFHQFPSTHQYLVSSNVLGEIQYFWDYMGRRPLPGRDNALNKGWSLVTKARVNV